MTCWRYYPPLTRKGCTSRNICFSLCELCFQHDSVEPSCVFPVFYFVRCYGLLLSALSGRSVWKRSVWKPATGGEVVSSDGLRSYSVS